MLEVRGPVKFLGHWQVQMRTYVTAAGWGAGNTRLNFVRPGSDPVGTHAGLL